MDAVAGVHTAVQRERSVQVLAQKGGGRLGHGVATLVIEHDAPEGRRPKKQSQKPRLEQRVSIRSARSITMTRECTAAGSILADHAPWASSVMAEGHRPAWNAKFSAKARTARSSEVAISLPAVRSARKSNPTISANRQWRRLCGRRRRRRGHAAGAT